MASLTQAHEARAALDDPCRVVTEDEGEAPCGTQRPRGSGSPQETRGRTAPVSSHVRRLVSVTVRTVRRSGCDHVSGRFGSDKIKTGNPSGFHSWAVRASQSPGVLESCLAPCPTCPHTRSSWLPASALPSGAASDTPHQLPVTIKPRSSRPSTERRAFPRAEKKMPLLTSLVPGKEAACPQNSVWKLEAPMALCEPHVHRRRGLWPRRGSVAHQRQRLDQAACTPGPRFLLVSCLWGQREELRQLQAIAGRCPHILGV